MDKMPDIGSYIIISLNSEIHRSRVLRIVEDPLKRHETKAIVSIDGELYGFTLNDILDHHPIGQLTLFN